MKRTYLVVFEKCKSNWSAFAPDVPGTGGLGETVEEARQSLREGISYMLEDFAERGCPMPDARSTSVDFAEFDPNPSESHYEIEWLTVDLPETGNHRDDLSQSAA